MSQKLHILIVDPQNDFCTADDGHGNKGTLVVPGADADMSRLSRLIRRLGDRIDGISTTMDSHQTIGIERPRWWMGPRSPRSPVSGSTATASGSSRWISPPRVSATAR